MALSQIKGFFKDEAGDWVAELACGHNQHMRHTPPWQVRPWVLEKNSRESLVDERILCPLCTVSAKQPSQ